VKNKINDVRIGVRAQQQFEKIRKNIEEHNSPKTANRFVTDFVKVKDQLKKTPEIFEESRVKKGARCGKIDKHRSFLYRVYATFIRIVAIFDTRTKNNYK
jgi:plasmid stabilization system protein ParE